MTHPRRHIPKLDSITRADSKAQLAMLLASATDERLRAFSAQGLAAMFKVPAAECQRMLLEAQLRRSARG